MVLKKLILKLLYLYFFRNGLEDISWSQGLRQNQAVHSKHYIFTFDQTIWKSDTIADTNTGNLLDDNNSTGSEVVELNVDSQIEPKLLQPGTYKYDFSWKLPDDLPPSFLDQLDHTWVDSKDSIVPTYMGKERSSIVYFVTAELDVRDNDKQEIISSSCYFNIIYKIEEPHRNPKPIILNESKTFLFGNNMPLTATLTLPSGKMIFKGQKLPLNLDICNTSNRTVESVKIDLEVITSLSSADKKESVVKRDIVLSTFFPSITVSPNKKINTDVTLNIPDNMPVTVFGKLISKRFELSCELNVQMATNLIMKTDMTVLTWYDELQRLEEENPSAAFSIDTDDEDQFIDM